METLDFSDVFITKVSFIALPGGRSPLNLNPSVWMSQNRIARLQNVAFKNFNHRLAREARESRTANLSHLPPVRTSETHCVRFLATVPPSSVLSRSNIILRDNQTQRVAMHLEGAFHPADVEATRRHLSQLAPFFKENPHFGYWRAFNAVPRVTAHTDIALSSCPSALAVISNLSLVAEQAFHHFDGSRCNRLQNYGLALRRNLPLHFTLQSPLFAAVAVNFGDIIGTRSSLTDTNAGAHFDSGDDRTACWVVLSFPPSSCSMCHGNGNITALLLTSDFAHHHDVVGLRGGPGNIAVFPAGVLAHRVLGTCPECSTARISGSLVCSVLLGEFAYAHHYVHDSFSVVFFTHRLVSNDGRSALFAESTEQEAQEARDAYSAGTRKRHGGLNSKKQRSKQQRREKALAKYNEME